MLAPGGLLEIGTATFVLFANEQEVIIKASNNNLKLLKNFFCILFKLKIIFSNDCEPKTIEPGIQKSTLLVFY